ncbi:MAG: HD domain-containing protein [Rubripirellula sp.]|nr:HD domain-containing protein [Rubripirellula sp.]
MHCLDFIPIRLATLMPSSTIGLDLYQVEIETETFILYRGGEYPLTMEDLNRLRGRGIEKLFIAKDSQASYQEYLRNIATSTDDKAVPLSVRTEAVTEVVRQILQATFTQDCVDQTVEAAEQLGSLTADILTNDQFAVKDMMKVLHHDYATFTHSANVAFYCGMLAAELGYPKQVVEDITAGGLLHDLGKLEIRDELLRKPDKLTDFEFREIRMHPTLGFKKLAHREDLVEGQLMMTYQHHERLDGKGYPVGCVEDEIHPWAKMCTVVDVYEALTSNRAYRKAMTQKTALQIMEREVGTAFDPELFQCWQSIIKQS